MPSATCSRFHERRASSTRTTSGALTLTTISRSKSRPASKSRYVWVGRAKQYLQACVHPRYGLIVHRNGIRDAGGTSLRMDFALTS